MKKLILLSVFLFVAFFGFLSCSDSGESPEKINIKLQKIENDLYILINNGDQKKALELVGSLTHASTDDWEQREKIDTIFGVGMFGGYYSYNEWWNERREKLRTEIMNMNNFDKHERKEEAAPKTPSTSNIHVNRNVKLDSRYHGLYVFQSESGNTHFFKFINDQANDGINILYQDNLSGEVKIENYKLKKFNDSSGEAVLQNKKDTKDTKKVFFRKDPESDNGFKLMDSKGVVYTFVSK